MSGMSTATNIENGSASTLLTIGTDVKLRTKVQAPKLTPYPLPRELLATLMRGVSKATTKSQHPKPLVP